MFQVAILSTNKREYFAVLALYGGVSPAAASQHSWSAQTVVPHAEQWGGIKVNQSTVFPGDAFELITITFIESVVPEPHLNGSLLVVLLQFCYYLFKGRQERIASLCPTSSSPSMALAPYN